MAGGTSMTEAGTSEPRPRHATGTSPSAVSAPDEGTQRRLLRRRAHERRHESRRGFVASVPAAPVVAEPAGSPAAHAREAETQLSTQIRRPYRRSITITVMAIACLTGALALVARIHLTSVQEGARDHVTALADARRDLIALVSVPGSPAAPDLAHASTGLTPRLRQRLASGADAVAASLFGGQVRSGGTIADVGVVSVSGSTAHVMAAASADVDGNRIAYRMRATLRRLHGRWLIDELEVLR